MTKRPTIAEVARDAGVSLPTVSRVLNNRPDVSSETRQRVQEVIERLGFQPSAVARSLDARRTHTVAFTTFRFEKRGLLSDPYFAGVMSGIVDTLTPLGIFVVVYPVVDSEEATCAFQAFLNSGRVDGLIVHNAEVNDPLLSSIAAARTPCVLLQHDKPVHERSVTVNVDSSGFRLLVDYLTSKGHREIGLIHGDTREHFAATAVKSFREAMAGHGLAVRDDWVQGGKWYEEGGAEGMRRILGASERPTAVLANTDLMAIGAMEAIRAAGLRVPDDIAVTGYNDDPYAKHLNPALTTLHYAFGELGGLAARSLMALIDEVPGAASDGFVPVELLTRASA